MILTVTLDNLKLQFTVLHNSVAKLWIERMQQRHRWPLDDPKRFYGFNSLEKDKSNALRNCQVIVQEINAWNPIIEKTLSAVEDQDTLNYLHSVFEQWHGLLDQQPRHPVYGIIPNYVRKLLADLNVAVHRCESVARGNAPRFVCTWYGMPKDQELPEDIRASCGVLSPEFGTVCLNYCEVGKTLEDLVIDRDRYISAQAFKPFKHFSADFVTLLSQPAPTEITKKLYDMNKYYDEHKEFFVKLGYNTPNHIDLMPLRYPVARLIETMPRNDLLKEIAKQQIITDITLE